MTSAAPAAARSAAQRGVSTMAFFYGILSVVGWSWCVAVAVALWRDARRSKRDSIEGFSVDAKHE